MKYRVGKYVYETVSVDPEDFDLLAKPVPHRAPVVGYPFYHRGEDEATVYPLPMQDVEPIDG